MSTQIRPEVSKKSTYWIPRHRYYELKHFVMQYPEWQEYVRTTDSMVQSYTQNVKPSNWNPSDPVYDVALKRQRYLQYIDMCNDIALNVDEDLYGGYLIAAICNNYSYEKVLARNPALISCSKDRWYEIYRKFFWMLDKKRM